MNYWISGNAVPTVKITLGRADLKWHHSEKNTVHVVFAYGSEYLEYQEFMDVTSTINDSLFALTTSTEYDIHNCLDHFY